MFFLPVRELVQQTKVPPGAAASTLTLAPTAAVIVNDKENHLLQRFGKFGKLCAELSACI